MKAEEKLELDSFVKEWKDTPEKNKDMFVLFRKYLGAKEGVKLNFISRPGVTYSLRAVHDNQQQKELFVMVDVIEDDPRWLSICFYKEMISDPMEMGGVVPGGLLGEDAVCFDLMEWDDNVISYVEKRLDEACLAAAKG